LVSCTSRQRLGNFDGDWQMLQWTAAGPGARFAGIVHHTDAALEYARPSKIGQLDKAWDDAKVKCLRR
jgi:hypothetical protein